MVACTSLNTVYKDPNNDSQSLRTAERAETETERNETGATKGPHMWTDNVPIAGTLDPTVPLSQPPQYLATSAVSATCLYMCEIAWNINTECSM